MSIILTSTAGQAPRYGAWASADDHLLDGLLSFRFAFYFNLDTGASSADRVMIGSNAPASGQGLEVYWESSPASVQLRLFHGSGGLAVAPTMAEGEWYLVFGDVAFQQGAGSNEVVERLWVVRLSNEAVVNGSQSTVAFPDGFQADNVLLWIGANVSDAKRMDGELADMLIASGTWSAGQIAADPDISRHKLIMDAGEQASLLFYAPYVDSLSDTVGGLTATSDPSPAFGAGPDITRYTPPAGVGMPSIDAATTAMLAMGEL